MSLSLHRSPVFRSPQAAFRVTEPGHHTAAAPLRVREWSEPEPAAADVLEGAEEMRFVAVDTLPAVVRALELAGRAVVLGYDDQAQQLIFYSQRKRIPCGGRASAATAAPARAAVRADVAAYENESSERRSSGSVSVAPGEWWSATLTAPITDAGTLFVELERRGATPASYRGEGSAELSVPEAEIDAVIALLAGVVAQARQDGVLPVDRGRGESTPRE